MVVSCISAYDLKSAPINDNNYVTTSYRSIKVYCRCHAEMYAVIFRHYMTSMLPTISSLFLSLTLLIKASYAVS
jgi:hypothetical protein